MKECKERTRLSLETVKRSSSGFRGLSQARGYSREGSGDPISRAELGSAELLLGQRFRGQEG